jgi:hypothetical protein
MSRRLRIVVAIAQVTAVALAYGLPKIASPSANRSIFSSVLERLVDALNYPVMACWYVIFLVADSVFRLPSTGGPGFTIEVVALAILVLSSVAAFWYYAVLEMQLRQQGRSCLRFDSPGKQILVSCVMLLFGLVAIAYAGYIARFALNPANVQWDRVIYAIVLCVWCVTLVRLAISDLRLFFISRK